MIKQLGGCGGLLVVVGAMGLIMPLFGATNPGSSRKAIWQAFALFSETIGSMTIASIVVIAFGLALILLAVGIEEYRKEKRARDLYEGR
jgi:hypothetical protein